MNIKLGILWILTLLIILAAFSILAILYPQLSRLRTLDRQNEMICSILSEAKYDPSTDTVYSVAKKAGKIDVLKALGISFDGGVAENEWGDRFDPAVRVSDGKALVIPSGPNFGIY